MTKNSANFIHMENLSKVLQTTSLLGRDGLGMNLRPFKRLTLFSFKRYKLKIGPDAGDIASLSISLETSTNESVNFDVFGLKFCLKEYWNSVVGGGGRGKLMDEVMESIH